MFGKMLTALDIKERHTNSEKIRILNDFSRRRIYILYLTVSGECEGHAEEELNSVWEM
jgi:hypothetical protein